MTDNAKHTPGPWTVWPDLDVTGTHDDRHSFAAGVAAICDDDDRQGTGVAAANARLIAAAPELLAAVEDAEFLLRKLGQLAGPMQDSCNRSAEDARAAIRKARAV